MFAWIASNIASILITVGLIAVITAAVLVLCRDKKKGKCSCGGNCGCCPMSGACHNKKS